MLEEAKIRTQQLQIRMKQQGIQKAVFTDESSIAYLAGFWGYLGIEFGRPTMLVVDADDAPVVITPLMESEMVAAMTWVENVQTWEDIGSRSWGRAMQQAVGPNPAELWIERNHIPAIVRNFIDEAFKGLPLKDISPVLGEMRMIKTPFEIDIMKQAGQIAGAMMEAAHNSLAEGRQEYESALAVINAGSRKAASFLTADGWESFVSPMIHNLQILQSGSDSSMVHRRASVKAYEKFDPVYFCFCNMAQFKQYKLGFDRMFYTYILRSEQNPERFYYGFSSDLKKRLKVHNQGGNVSTKTGLPWTLAWYGGFESESTAIDFERYLKTASGKAFARKRLLRT